MLRRKPMLGWWVQQLIKLAACDHVGTDWYLTLDADVICVRPWRYGDLIKDGRALSVRYGYEKAKQHAEWYRDAAGVLSLPESRWIHGVTPALLHREAVRMVARHIGRRTLFARPFGWRAELIRTEPWSEYTLYNTSLEARGLYDRYYWVGTGLHRNSLWDAADFDAWDPFSDAQTYFIVAESTAGIPAEQIWKKVVAPVESTSRNGK